MIARKQGGCTYVKTIEYLSRVVCELWTPGKVGCLYAKMRSLKDKVNKVNIAALLSRHK